MKKIYIVILAIIIILVGVIFFTQSYHPNEIKVNSAYFTIPEGYVEGELNKDGHTNLTNGHNSVFIAKCVNEDLDSNVNEYVRGIELRNLTVSSSKFSNGNAEGYKVIVGNDTNTTHYWFKKDNQVFTIYSWDVNNNLDNIVNNLIASAKIT